MSTSYKRHRFPSEIISYCVWLYYTFPLSFRDIEKMMLFRGICVTYEAIRKWCLKFAQAYANQLRRRRAKLADKWQPCGFVKIRKSPLKLLGKEKQPFITQEGHRFLSSILLG